MINSSVRMSGELTTKHIPCPRAPLSWRVQNALRWNYLMGWLAVNFYLPLARKLGVLYAVGELRAIKTYADGRREDYGVISRHSVTTAFVNFVVDQLQTETSVFGDFKFHDSGVGTTAENITDTGIETTDGEARATGTQTETSANIYRSVGTISYTTTKAITEHGLFNDATTGTLMDRSVFSAINVVNGDSISYTYSLTVSAGG